MKNLSKASQTMTEVPIAKLYFYYAAMNAGKTTALLQSSYNYRERGMATLLYTPTIDTRYGSGQIVSRIGLDHAAISFSPEFDFYQDVLDRRSDLGPLACVMVDEAQFLRKEQVSQLARVVDNMGVPVLAYGLRTDFKGETFEGSHFLLAWADTLQELKTICFCGRKATMNGRLNEGGQLLTEGSQIDIGGNEKYVALCRRHFLEGSLA
jgi:thymidine kinase